MSLAITKKPTVRINTSECKWYPAHQPITFEITRIDALVQQKYTISGTEIHMKMNFIPSGLKVGQNITIIKGTKSYTVPLIGFSTTHLKVAYSYNIAILQTSCAVNYTGLYKSYYIETLIHKVNISNQYQAVGSSLNKVDSFGIAKVSVQKWVQNACTYQNQFLYNKINQKQIGEGAKFNIKYREVYNGKPQQWSVLSETNCLYWTNSAKQVQEHYGYNMAEYTPTYDNSRTEKAKFQSVFNKPTYFVGYPFSLNFIYSDNLANWNVYRKEDTFNINGATIASTSDLININERFFANRLMMKQGYSSTVKEVNIWLETDGTVSLKKPVKEYVVDGVLKGYGITEFIKPSELA